MRKTLAMCFGLMFFVVSPSSRADEPPPPLKVAQASPPAPAPPPAAAAAEVKKTTPPKPPGRFFAHANVAFNVYTYLGPMGDGIGPRAETHLHPGNRAVLFQQLGFGYFFHPKLRVQLTFQVGETLSGLPAGKDTVALFGIIPWLVFTHKGFVAGIGPLFAPISANTVPRFDAGIFFATGYSFKLPHNFSLGALVQLVTLFNERVSVAVSPAVLVGYRF